MLRPVPPLPARLPLCAAALLTLSSLAACHAKPAPTATIAPSASASASARSRAELFASPDDLLPASDPLADADASIGLPSAAAERAPSGPPALTLTSPGAEPRAPLAYDFATGKLQTATLRLTTRVSQEGDPGADGDEQMPPLRLTLSIVAAGGASPDSSVFQVHVKKAEIAPGVKGVPPEAALEMKELSKILATIDATIAVSKRGVIEDVDFSGDPETQGAAASVLSLLEDAFALFFVPVPEEPVGIGAEWKTAGETPPGMPRGALSKTYTLTARSPGAATIEEVGRQDAPEQPLRDPQAPPGLTIAIASKEKVTVKLRLNGIASKGTSEGETVITTRDPSAAPPRAVVAHMKRSQQLEAP